MSISASIAFIVKILLLPPMSLFLLYLAGLCIAKRQPRASNFIRIAAISLLFFLSTGLASWLLVHPLEALESALDKPKDAAAQAIVILTAGRLENNPEYQGQDRPDYIALARLHYGAHLYRVTGLPILVTGGLGPSYGFKEALAPGMKRALETDFLVPVRWLEQQASTTDENASFSAKILKQAGIQRVLLVTDAMHMRRSRIAFEKAGLEVISAPTFFLESAPFDPFRLLPGAENLRRSHYAVYEWLGLIWYRSFEK